MMTIDDINSINKYVEYILLQQFDNGYRVYDNHDNDEFRTTEFYILKEKSKFSWVKYLKDNGHTKSTISYGTTSDNYNHKMSTMDRFRTGTPLQAYFINHPDGYYITLLDIKFVEYREWLRQNKLNELV